MEVDLPSRSLIGCRRVYLGAGTDKSGQSAQACGDLRIRRRPDDYPVGLRSSALSTMTQKGKVETSDETLIICPACGANLGS
jgi:hypothetical protein